MALKSDTLYTKVKVRQLMPASPTIKASYTAMPPDLHCHIAVSHARSFLSGIIHSTACTDHSLLLFYSLGSLRLSFVVLCWYMAPGFLEATTQSRPVVRRYNRLHFKTASHTFNQLRCHPPTGHARSFLHLPCCMMLPDLAPNLKWEDRRSCRCEPSPLP